MTVRELIKHLEKYSLDDPVAIVEIDSDEEDSDLIIKKDGLEFTLIEVENVTEYSGVNYMDESGKTIKNKKVACIWA